MFKRFKAKESRSAASRFFSELPPNRADTAPKSSAILSNVTSRARDLVPGGDAAMPRMLGDAEAPMVKLEPDEGPSGRPDAESPVIQPTKPSTDRAAESPRPQGLGAQEKNEFEAKATSLRPSEVDTIRLTDRAPRGSQGAAGNSDFRQPEMASPYGNAPLTGDVSLNTIAWDYAPWLQRFGRQLMRQWYPPPAYSLGILKQGGWALVEVEISRSGKLLRLELLEEKGHESLILAAQSAIRSVSPIQPLPADFPEPTLILRIRMIYPRVRSR